MFKFLVVAVAALGPPIALLRWFVASDRFPQRPDRILGAFWLGTLIAPAMGFLMPLRVLWAGHPDPAVAALRDAFFGAALPEEGLKWLVLWFYAARRGLLRDPMDGVVFGATASLGFAAAENLMYVMMAPDWLATAAQRGLTAVPAHAAAGVIMGTHLGLAALEPSRRARHVALSFLAPVALHGLYDWPLLTMRAAVARGLFPSGPFQTAMYAAVVVVLVAGFLRARHLFRRARAAQAARLRPGPWGGPPANDDGR